MEVILGRNLLEFRLVRSMTLAEVAKACGLSKGQLSRIENGRVSPPLSTIGKIARALEAEPGMLPRRQEATDWQVLRGPEIKLRRKWLVTSEHHHEVLSAKIWNGCPGWDRTGIIDLGVIGNQRSIRWL
jgi:transcriptional regulator with XRE-family HTH domain